MINRTPNPSLHSIPDLKNIRDFTPLNRRWTEHTHAIAARLKTGHREPQMPKEALHATGKLMWYVAPMRPEIQMKVPEIR